MINFFFYQKLGNFFPDFSDPGTCSAHWEFPITGYPGCVRDSHNCKNGRRSVYWYVAFYGCKCECLCENGYLVYENCI